MKTLLALLALAGCHAHLPIDLSRATETAVLIMDVQVDFVGSRAPLPVAAAHAEQVVAGSNALARAARRAGAPVIYVANAFPADATIANWFRRGAAIAGTPGAALDPRLDAPGAPLHKAAADAFSNPALDATLRAGRVGHLIVTGVFADQCVAATVEAALDRGYRVTVVADAVGAKDDARRREALADLRARGAEVLDTHGVLSRWAGGVAHGTPPSPRAGLAGMLPALP